MKTKKNYYWQFDPENEFGMFGGHEIIVVEKEFWEENNCADDQEFTVPELKALGFVESCESLFEAPEGLSKEEIREKLEALDIFEEKEMF